MFSFLCHDGFFVFCLLIQIISGIFCGDISHPNTKPQPLIPNGTIKQCKYIKHFLLNIDSTLICDKWCNDKLFSGHNNAKHVGMKLRFQLKKVCDKVQMEFKKLIETEIEINNQSISNDVNVINMQNTTDLNNLNNLNTRNTRNTMNYRLTNNLNRGQIRNTNINNNNITINNMNVNNMNINNINNNYNGYHNSSFSVSQQRYTPMVVIPQIIVISTTNNSNNNIYNYNYNQNNNNNNNNNQYQFVLFG